jgi:hypothetical protein
MDLALYILDTVQALAEAAKKGMVPDDMLNNISELEK